MYYLKNIINLIKKLINFKVAFTEMYPRISWYLVADALVSVQHTSGTSGLRCPQQFLVSNDFCHFFGKKIFLFLREGLEETFTYRIPLLSHFMGLCTGVRVISP
jgi:hypothetical protein